MEYVYAALILNEAEEEINEDNLTEVLEAAGVNVEESRVKALVAALEDVDIDEAIAEAAPVAPAGGAAPVAEEPEEAPEEEEAEAADDEDEDDEEDEASGEGLGELFG